ncbi:MAG TPA: SDR family NAD(P)-dependent oxidoreductase [Kineosporiaceae bacterium]|nr:SDR family NAD(P)-dependent oxidoreductase [Kineosporiaceae bacterium]
MARIFITGSSTGLGLLAAQRLLTQGHEVLAHARNEQRAADLHKALPEVPIVIGDLSLIEETRSVAEQVNTLGRPDAVIHNAAVYQVPHRIETGDGLCLTFAVNVLAPYLLTALIKRPDRLVYLTSGMQSGARAKLDDAQWTRRRWDWMQAYSESKLFDTMLAFGVARRWPQVHANSVNPGWVPTRMGGAGAPDDLELGMQTQAWLAAGDDREAAVTGQYFFHQRSSPVPELARRPGDQDALFEYCAELTGQPLA